MIFQRKHIETIKTACCCLLVLLWVYTAGSKLADFTAFKRSLAGQDLPFYLTSILQLALPPSELLLALLLCINKTRLLGLKLSLVLLAIFTLYIIIILLTVKEGRPCSCGGVLTILTWETHLLFNLGCILICWLGLICHTQERRSAKRGS